MHRVLPSYQHPSPLHVSWPMETCKYPFQYASWACLLKTWRSLRAQRCGALERRHLSLLCEAGSELADSAGHVESRSWASLWALPTSDNALACACPLVSLCHRGNLFPMCQGGQPPSFSSPFYPSRSGMGSETPSPVTPLVFVALSACCQPAPARC